MNRDQLAHVLGAACRIASDKDVIVVGSQAILGSFDEDDLPSEATMSEEADVAFKYDFERRKADLLTSAIGELSDFHGEYDYYVDGVDIELIALPDGWEDRLVAWDVRSSEPADPRFLEPHDLAVSKLVAHRDKDRAFVAALLRGGLINAGVLRERTRLLPEEHARSVPVIESWLDGQTAQQSATPIAAARASGSSGANRGKPTPDSTRGSFAPRDN